VDLIKPLLVWIPGYQRILGNKEVDKLAKEGTNKVPVDQTASIPFAVEKKSSQVIQEGST
jgi:hypothetical protein